MGNCCSSSGAAGHAGGLTIKKRDPDSHPQLAKETHFTVDEVYALGELYKKVSNSLHQDGVIQKDEFMHAIFGAAPDQANFFADRLFAQFDLKRNNIIDFGEFVRSLSVFHPKAPLEEKAEFALQLYDLDKTGDIQPGEVKRLLVALLNSNPDIALDERVIAQIVDQLSRRFIFGSSLTFEEADIAKDGRISKEEWIILCKNQPAIISFMTLPLLKNDLTKKYPSFIFNV